MDERALIDAIVNGDDASRHVYADWLEQHGDGARAELIRLYEQLVKQAPGRDEMLAALARLRELAGASGDVEWRMQIARPRILHCRTVPCPGEWGALKPTEWLNERSCTTCNKPVMYATTDVEQSAYGPGPVVMDANLRRVVNTQLAHGESVGADGACPRCARVNAPYFRFCLGCAVDLQSNVACRQCGKPNARDAEACYACGLQLRAVFRTSNPPPPGPVVPREPAAIAAQVACVNCGKLHDAQARFCIGCGNALRAAPAASPPVVVCGRCGNANQAHYAFCLGCGFDLRSSEPPAYTFVTVGTSNPPPPRLMPCSACGHSNTPFTLACVRCNSRL